MISLKPPIFLLGNVRSGTSLIHDLFNMHPEVASWYEPRTIWVYADPARKHDRFDETDATERVKRYIRKRFLKYQQKNGDLRIMEKTPSNLMRIPYVRAIFPESKYLYMIREPLAYLSSSELKWRVPISLSHTIARFLEAPKAQLPYYLGRFIRDNIRSRIFKNRYVSTWGIRYPGIQQDQELLSTEQVIAKQWAAASRQVEEDLSKVDPDLVLRMHYEDFVADPVNQFEQIVAHFDLDLPSELAEHVRRVVDPNRQAKWKRMNPNVLRSCLPYLENEMRRHGYEHQIIEEEVSDVG